MKKIFYTIAFLLAATTIANAQSPKLQSEQEITAYMVLESNFIVFTRQDADGQFIYTERWQEDWSSILQKETNLNAGTINIPVGRNEDGTELYVYQQLGRNKAVISFYALKDRAFEKTGERVLPKLNNRSGNLDLHLSEDKSVLLIAADMRKSNRHEDLYISYWQNNRWSKPENLGKQVNTHQAEYAPFVDGETLYFTRKNETGSAVYSATFKQGAIQAAPTKLDEGVNARTYNSHFKKFFVHEFWLGQENDKTYTLYNRTDQELLALSAEGDEMSFVGAVSGSQDPGRIKTAADTTIEEDEEDGWALPESSSASGFISFVSHSQSPHAAFELDRIEAEKNHMVTRQSDGMTMHYQLNQVYIGQKQAQLLHAYLRTLPKNSKLNVKGFADTLGSKTANQKISRQRAQLLRAYIQQNFAAKNFNVTIEHRIGYEAGKHFRLAEIKVVK